MASIEPISRVATGPQRFTLKGIPWDFYEALREIPENFHVRLTFNRGVLELMAPSEEHEEIKGLIGRMIETLTEELGIPLRSRGSTTWKKPELDCALEADECYYIRSYPLVAGRKTVDLATDPPPDLAVESEVSRSAIDKMAIYAELGVPEVWRSDGASIHALHLNEVGRYDEIEQSWNLPFLRVSELGRFLREFDDADETAWIRSFRKWVRETFGGA